MRPDEFVFKVVRQYRENKAVFSNKVNAEELIPEELDSLGKALFIFYVLQLDYAMKSQILYKGANRLYRDMPGFFTPKFLPSSEVVVLANYLTEYLHPRYINEAVKRYKLNSQVLDNDYKGDPRKIFKQTKICKDVVGRLKKFRGFGPKIGNFFIRTMINTFGYSYSDIDEILPPVDVHDVRIAYLMGYIDNAEMTQQNIMRVKKLWNKACLDSKESWLVFDKALWLLGSEGKPKSKEDIFKLLNYSEL